MQGTQFICTNSASIQVIVSGKYSTISIFLNMNFIGLCVSIYHSAKETQVIEKIFKLTLTHTLVI